MERRKEKRLEQSRKYLEENRINTAKREPVKQMAEEEDKANLRCRSDEAKARGKNLLGTKDLNEDMD